MIEYAFELKDLELAREIMEQFEKQPGKIDETLPYFAMAKALIDRDMNAEAGKVLDRLPPLQTLNKDEVLDAAILKRKAKDYQKAHSFFQEVYSLSPNDPRVIYEFARTKIKLAKNTPGENNGQIKKQLNREAVELLRKAIGLTTDSTKKAWCWLELARSLDWLGSPNNEIREAFLKARPQLSNEPSFITAYERWQSKSAANGTPTGLWNRLKSFFASTMKK